MILTPWFALLCTFCSLVGAAVNDCNKPIGVGDSNIIADQDFSASSIQGGNYPYHARLVSDNGQKSWCFKNSDSSPFIKVKLPAEYRITKIALQGKNTSGAGKYVKTLELVSVSMGARFPYPMLLRGNVDKTSVRYQDLNISPVVGEEIIIHPRSWYPAWHGCLRFELYGCRVEPEVKQTTPKPTTTPIDYCAANNGGCQHICKNSANGPECSCKTGHRLDKNNQTCSDINECVEGNSCDPDTTFCHDIIGSYLCYCKNRTLIHDPKNRFRCIDKDECSQNNGNCEQVCFNTPLGYRCGCNSGFILNRDGRHCDDVNECLKTPDVCDKGTTVCNNTNGGFECICKPGFRKLSGDPYKCVDINECNFMNGGCQQKCINLVGSHKCDCVQGYELNSDKRSCRDIDECIRDAPCNLTLSACQNTKGSFKCECFSGLKNDPNDKTKCININECSMNNGGCDHYCHDIYRSHYCTCKPKYHLGTDGRTCLDDNECYKNNGGCQQQCINFDGGYRCDCKSGFRLSTTDYKSCNDINECSVLNGGCEKYCNNTEGSYFCSCDKGFRVVGKYCFDEDECSTGNHNCNPNTSVCINTHGSFECRCKPSYTKDPVTGQCLAQTCSSLVAPSNGFVEPVQCSQHGNAAGTRCSYKCNAGYKLQAASATFAYCSSNGNWLTPDGDSPRCEPIRCHALSAVKNGYLLPSECSTTGALFGKSCVMDCSSGYDYVGSSSVNCKADGTYDGDFSGSKCVTRPTLKCPADKTVVLPIGRKTVRVSVGELLTNMPDSQLQSVPNGVLDGSYEFPLGFTAVKIVARNEANRQVECSFTVTVQDKELPTVSNCDASNQYISIDGSTGVVTWKEPVFSDNVGIYRTSVNLKNGEVRQPQVYFVDYSVRDKSGNRASCRFFVHVQAKYCDLKTMPGGNDVIKSMFSTPTTMFVSLQCPTGKTFSNNISDYMSWAKCFRSSAMWSPSEVPSCVGYLPLTKPCPAGTQLVRKYPSTISVQDHVCANCVKGTFFSSEGKCEKCPDGYYQDEEAKTSCKQCPAGSKTLFKGASSIIQCKALCEKGSFSTNGLKPFTGCMKCPIGSYQNLDGQTFCEICPEGGQTTAEGAKHENECFFPARITKVVPELQELNAYVGDTINIECTATGSPRPYLSITNTTSLAPESFRGTSTITNLPSSSAYVVSKRLTITNVQLNDSHTYKCSASNQAGINGWKDEREIVVSVKSRPLAS